MEFLRFQVNIRRFLHIVIKESSLKKFTVTVDVLLMSVKNEKLNKLGHCAVT